MVSRGKSPSKIVQSSLWWEDPDWLKLDEEKWSKSIIQCLTTLLEQIANILVIKELTFLNDLISKYSQTLKVNSSISICFSFYKQFETAL